MKRDGSEAQYVGEFAPPPVSSPAAATHAPLNTVRSRLRLAKEALRSGIGNDDPRWAELPDVPS